MLLKTRLGKLLMSKIKFIRCVFLDLQNMRVFTRIYVLLFQGQRSHEYSNASSQACQRRLARSLKVSCNKLSPPLLITTLSLSCYHPL